MKNLRDVCGWTMNQVQMWCVKFIAKILEKSVVEFNNDQLARSSDFGEQFFGKYASAGPKFDNYLGFIKLNGLQHFFAQKTRTWKHWSDHAIGFEKFS